MTCPHDSSGQSLCRLEEHPDKLGVTYCTTCKKQFQDLRFSSNPEPQRRLPPAIVDLITGVLALFLAAVVNGFVRDAEPQPPTQEAAIQVLFLAASQEPAKHSENDTHLNSKGSKPTNESAS
jgi:hypothetical protein